MKSSRDVSEKCLRVVGKETWLQLHETRFFFFFPGIFVRVTQFKSVHFAPLHFTSLYGTSPRVHAYIMCQFEITFSMECLHVCGARWKGCSGVVLQQWSREIRRFAAYIVRMCIFGCPTSAVDIIFLWC